MYQDKTEKTRLAQTDQTLYEITYQIRQAIQSAPNPQADIIVTLTAREAQEILYALGVGRDKVAERLNTLVGR